MSFSRGKNGLLFNENVKNFLTMTAEKIDLSIMGLENVSNIFNNYGASVDPSGTDDTSKGYSVGSVWINIVSRKSFVCTHPNVGVAVWKEITANATIDDTSTSDTDKVWSTQKLTTEFATKTNTGHTHVATDVTDFNSASDTRINTQKNQPNGIGGLDGNGKLNSAQIPAIALTSVTTVADIAARDLLVVEEGDVAMVTENGGSAYIYNGTGWVDWWNGNSLLTWNGLGPGAINVTTTDLPEGNNLYYTEGRVDANTNVSTNTTHISRTDNPHTVTATQVGLGNVLDVKDKNDATIAPTVNNDNTEDYSVRSIWVDVIADKSYICLDTSTGAANWTEITLNNSALDTHIADAGNPHSVTKTQVGLGNVEDLKIKLDGTGPPNVAQDDTQGYAIGSRWIDTTNQKAYTCIDASTGAAVWVETTNTYNHSSYDTHIADNTLHRIISDGSVEVDELWSGSYLNTQMQGKINHTETTLMNVRNGTPGSINHVGLELTKAHGGTDDYNIDVDSSVVKAILSQEGGTLRSALVLSDVATSGKTALGFSTSVNSGSTWNPKMVIRHNGDVGIANNNPQSKLDVTGETRTTTLTVNGNDVPGLKQKLDATIAPTANNDTTEGYAIGSNWIDITADKAYVCLDATDTAAVWKETTQVDTGEINTASNVGTGADIFKQKTGVDFEFRGINAASSKATAVVNADNIDIDVVPSNINIGDLNNAPTGSVIGTTDAQTLTNKTINADNSTITNIGDEEMKAGVNADKIADGTISNAEYQYLNGVTSAIQTQIDSHVHTASNVTDFDTEVGNHTDVSANTTHRTSDGSNHTFIDQNVTTTGTPSFGQITIDNVQLDGNIISSTNVDGNINLTPNGSGNVILKADPTTDLGAATKQYVDAVASGQIDYKDPVRLVTRISLPAYTQTGSGVGAKLEANATGLIPNIDGVVPALNDRILVETNATTSDVHNGIYEVTQLGSGAATWILTRTTDADEDAKVTTGLYVFVQEGTYGGNSAWILSTPDPIVVDTTALTFVEFSSVQQLSGSNVGGGGVAIFKQKNGNIMEYRTINTSSTKLSVTLDGGNNEVDLDVVPSNINIGDLNNAPTGSVIGTTDAQTLTNKTINADNSTITNIGDEEMKAGVNADKIADGTISNAEYQYLNSVSSNIQTQIDGKSATSHTHIIRQGHTWGISGEIKVPSGDTNFLLPFFVSLASGQTANIVSARHKINGGTSATVKVQKNDVDVTGLTGISVNTTSTTTNPSDVSLADNDKLALVVTGVAGTPKNLSFTLFLEHTI